MKGLAGVLVSICLLWLAGILEAAVSPRLSIAAGSPDFPLIVLVCMGMFCDRRGTTLLGFGAGLIKGSIAGANMTIYIATRSISGFLLGWFNSLDVQGTPLVAGITAFVITLIAQLLLLFLGVHHGPLPPYLAGTLTTAVYNGVIAVPVYALLNKFIGGGPR